MRIGLMVGSDKERSRADRLAGLMEDGRTAERDGFASFWIPQVPGYLDAMTAVALLGQVTERIEIGTAVVPDPDPSSADHGAAGADHPGRLLRAVHSRPRPVTPLDHLGPTRTCRMTARRGWSATTSTCWRPRSRVPAQWTWTTTTTACTARSTSPIHSRCQCFSPRSARPCSGSQASAPAEPSCGWPTSGRSATTWSRASPRRPQRQARSGTAHRRRRSRRPLLGPRSRRRPHVRQRSARPRRLLPQLCPAARTRRRRRRRRHHGGGRRVDRPRPAETATATRASPTSPRGSCRSAATRRRAANHGDVRQDFLASLDLD